LATKDTKEIMQDLKLIALLENKLDHLGTTELYPSPKSES